MTDPVAIGARAPSMMGSPKASDEASTRLFEMILAARSVGRAPLQPVGEHDVAGPAEIWHGAEVVARPGLDAASDAGEDGGRQVSAKVFNQDGFFGTSPSPWHDSAMATRGEVAVAVDRPPAEGAAAELALPSPPPGSATAVPHHPGSSAPGVRDLRAQTIAASKDTVLQAPGRESALVGVEAAPSGAPTVEPGGEVASPEMPERPILRCPTGFSPILVAMQELEHGLGIKAIIAGLDHGERLRLRDEILALLSSHGHSVGAVAIGGGRPSFWKKVK